MHHRRTAQDTLTAIEMDRRDQLDFVRADGVAVRITLLDTSAQLIRTNLDQIKVEKPGAVTELRFDCTFEIDGQRHTLTREVSTQNSFYEPFEIAGVRFWPDAVDGLFEFMDETHGPCRPRKHARLALQDASRRICPPPLHPWCPLAEEGLDIGECYNGDDTWMGGYFGASAHGGLDINHPRGTPIWAPLDLDDHFLFNTEAEHGNNRWRAFRRWPNGDLWTIQVHHVTRLTVPPHTTVSAGVQVADGAGVAVGAHDHSHFVFVVTHPGQPPIKLDPWILFWQMYQDRDAFADHFYLRAQRGRHTGLYPDD